MDIKKEVVKGLKWSSASKVGQQGLQVILSIILARLLLPEDFGILAMGMFFIGFVSLFSEFGIGSAVIQKQDLDDDDLSSIFWFNIVIGLLTVLLILISAPLIAAFFGKEVLKPLLSLMSLSLFFTALGTIPQAILMRDMNFRRLSIIEIASTLISGFIAISLAYKGYGVWSLAWQWVMMTMITSFLLWMTAHWRPKLQFRLSRVKSIMGFSLNLLGFSCVNYFSTNISHLLIGRFLGAEPLGYYTLAYRIILYPLQNFAGIISRVLFPAFSTIQSEHTRFHNAYLVSTRYIAFVTFPVMLGVFAVANELVLVVFGDTWMPAVFLVKVFCLIGIIQSISTTVGQIYLSKGRTDWMFRWSLLAASVVFIANSIGLLWGVRGVVIALLIAMMILIYPCLSIPFRLIGLKVKTFFAHLKREFVTSLIFFAFLIISSTLQRLLSIDAIFNLLSNIIFGAIIYLIIAKSMNRDAFAEMQALAWNRKHA